MTMGNVTFPIRMDCPEKYVAGFEFTPFHSSIRHSYFSGRLYDYRSYGPLHDSKCVVKVKKEFSASSKSCWESEILRADTAKDIATQLMKLNSALQINFMNMYPVEIDETSPTLSTLLRFWTRSLKEYEWILVSRYIKEVCPLVMNNPFKHPDLEALSHFSWHVTGGEMVMCDFRGRQESHTYTLLTPTIHSTDQKFGEKDNGEEGIRQFFRRHLCTNLCKSFLHPATSCKPVSGDYTRKDNLTNDTVEQSIASGVLRMERIDIKKT